MKRFGFWLTCAVLLAIGTQSPSACAADNLAAALFMRAERAFSNHQYEKAARLFEDADLKAPHPSVVYNAAVSWDYGGRPARAADAYKRALQREGLSTVQADDAEKRLEVLGNELGYVHIAKPVGGLATVAHVVRTPIPAHFYLEPGSYDVLVLGAGGVETTERITVLRGQTLRVEVVTVQHPPLAAVPPAPPPAPVANRTQELFGWATLGVGILAAGTGAYLGVRGLEERTAFYASNKTNGAARDASAQYRLGANVAWGGAAVLGVTGLTLALTSPTIRIKF